MRPSVCRAVVSFVISSAMPVSGTSVGRRLQPGLVVHLGARVHRAAGADQRVAAAQVQAEPGRLQPGDHGVQPERDLGELDGGGVEVDAVDLVQGDVRLDPLQFGAGTPRGRSSAPSSSWRRRQVLLGELADGLDGERPGARAPARRSSGRGSPRRSWSCPSWSSSSSSAWDDGEPGQHLGGVVRRRLLAFPAGQPEDERAPPVQDRPCARR